MRRCGFFFYGNMACLCAVRDAVRARRGRGRREVRHDLEDRRARGVSRSRRGAPCARALMERERERGRGSCRQVARAAGGLLGEPVARPGSLSGTGGDAPVGVLPRRPRAAGRRGRH
ncbi:hypothetical protein GUJ93_ZPchr0002g26301 [Zizania palustris]|uniref:Uncharacterized protein n=1 Tax=Zizania palustris TaxID=103762 RepID=A0A8J5SKB1_ZIZPA|nr:hypothetical protein GUJ93_ZPchr0002g26301 [Zizania palustris]